MQMEAEKLTNYFYGRAHKAIRRVVIKGTLFKWTPSIYACNDKTKLFIIRTADCQLLWML